MVLPRQYLTERILLIERRIEAPDCRSRCRKISVSQWIPLLASTVGSAVVQTLSIGQRLRESCDAQGVSDLIKTTRHYPVLAESDEVDVVALNLTDARSSSPGMRGVLLS
ncbi:MULTISPECIES: hypothetical protein [Kribbella]|uniref:hypothetical protein n=1 Tax=Kribbella TaxID=182639 RepID=UPI001045B00F|nr:MULTISPECIES: hypothetical protein [Kribbella]